MSVEDKNPKPEGQRKLKEPESSLEEISLILKVDSDFFPHVGGLRWAGQELLDNFYQNIFYEEERNIFYYQFDHQKAQIHAYDELLVVSQIDEDEAILLGGAAYPIVSPFFLDYKDRPLVYIEIDHIVCRALVSHAAYYEYVQYSNQVDSFDYWWEIPELVQERSEKVMRGLMEQGFHYASQLLEKKLPSMPRKSKWVYHPLGMTGDVHRIAQNDHYILCCEPEKANVDQRMKDDLKKLTKREQGKVDYFNNQFAPEEAKKFDVFFDHGLLNFVYPHDRENFFQYIASFEPRYFMGSIMLGHDFSGPPFCFTEKEVRHYFQSIGFEPTHWDRKYAFLNVVLEKTS